MSKNQEFYHIGEDIKDALEDALKTLDFTQLNDVISSTTNSAVSEFKNRWEYKTVSYRECPGSEKQKERTYRDFENKRKQPRETQKTALRNVKQRQVGQVSSVLYTVFGGIGTGVGSILALVFGLITVFATIEMLPGFVVGVLLLFASIGMLTKGGVQRGRLERFRRYLKLCGDKTYCDVKELASHVGKSYKYVLKDLKKMLQLNMLPEGHLDEKGTCLMLDDATYMQYVETSRNYAGKKEDAPIVVEEIPNGMTALAKEGQEYIRKLRELNDAIPGEVISEKLYRLEHVLTEIFEVLADHPQKQPQMRKFMEYYLPTTLKLVQTYADFDGVQIQGENITSAKQEIEQTLDTINTAFEKLLNDLFQDAAFDATTDAQVLQTLLAQEGLTEDAAFKNAGGESMSKELEELLKEEPTLTFEPFADAVKERMEAVVAGEPEKEELNVVLSPEEQAQVDTFAAQIDLSNSQAILQYGAGPQKKIADFSETALNNVRTKDMGEIGQLLTDVVSELKSLESGTEEKGFLGFFKKSSNRLTTLKAKYDKAEVNVNRISQAMEGHQITLLKDVAMLDKMYELNLNYFKELSMYILAGKQKLAQAQQTELPSLVAKAEESGLPEDTQKAKDYAALCNRFEKKVHDLELTRTIALQMAPQIRLIQENDTAMSEKIQSTLVNTIPLWKSQMVIAIGLSHSTDAAKAQKEVSDMTNELLRKNAETLKVATIETAKESERGIVDIETLKNTNQQLISTLDEVMKIQTDGRAKRQAAEAELQNIEDQMRQKLLEISR